MSEDRNDPLAGADPLAGISRDSISLGDARDELIAEIVAKPAPDERAKGPARSWSGRKIILRAGLAGGLACLIAFGIILSGGGSKPQEKSAYAAELVRMAEKTPLVILDLPGWDVSHIDVGSAERGSINFRKRLKAGQPRMGADLSWNTGGISEWVSDGETLTTNAPVLDTEAQVVKDGWHQGRQELSAFWMFNDRVMVLRSQVFGEKSFLALLAALKRVEVDTWLDAMPASVVKPEASGKVLRKMLRGIPIPPDFDPMTISGDANGTSRYQFGATVAGTIACTWIERWARARDTGDRAAVAEAVQAMSTSKEWPILKKMNRVGGYSWVLWEYAEAMPKGTWYGRPLEGDVELGLGCSDMGVDLGVPTAEEIMKLQMNDPG